MAELDLAIHTYSMVLNYKLRPGYDVWQFLDYSVSRGFTGVNLSLNGPGWRHLSGQSPAHLAKVRRYLEDRGLSLEIDTSNTEPSHMRALLQAGHDLGARNLRTFTLHRGDLGEMKRRTIEDLKRSAEDAERLGVEIVLENHEEFTGAELAEVVAAVGSPWVGAVYDYGNSQVVYEDPLAALDAMLPYARTLHLKDHLMLRPEHSPDGRLSILGVAMGEGTLPVMEITRRLIAAGHRRLVFQGVWSYRHPVERDRPGPGVMLGEGHFRCAEPPFDGERVLPDREPLIERDPLRVCDLEIAANDRGLAWLRAQLAAEGHGFKSSRKAA